PSYSSASSCFVSFFPNVSFYHMSTPDISALSLHDALPIWMSTPSSPASAFWASALTSARSDRSAGKIATRDPSSAASASSFSTRSEEHTSELQSRENLVCRLLLEKKNNKRSMTIVLILKE